jgi:hypothetical protein
MAFAARTHQCTCRHHLLPITFGRASFSTAQPVPSKIISSKCFPFNTSYPLSRDFHFTQSTPPVYTLDGFAAPPQPPQLCLSFTPSLSQPLPGRRSLHQIPPQPPPLSRLQLPLGRTNRYAGNSSVVAAPQPLLLAMHIAWGWRYYAQDCALPAARQHEQLYVPLPSQDR